MALLVVGQQVNIQLRTGEWIRNATILAIAGNRITVKQVSGPDKSLDQHADIVVTETITGTTV